MSDIQDRWTEIQFYYICKDLQEWNNDIAQLLDFIDILAGFGNFSSTVIQHTAQKVLSSTRCRPFRDELIVIAYKADVPLKIIQEYVGIRRKMIYNVVVKEQQNPQMYLPTTSPNEINEMNKFIETFDSLRKVGTYGSRIIPTATKHSAGTGPIWTYAEPL